MYNGYDFYFKIGDDLLTLPITPSELTIKNGSNNEVVTLINEGDINILKSPSLTDINFKARFPMRKYPYSREPLFFEEYFDKFIKVKENKQTFRFSVVRSSPDGSNTWGTSYIVSLEDLKTEESADNGDDVIVSFELRQYKDYGVKILQSDKPPDSGGDRNNDNKGEESSIYVVQSGDCLWNIAKAAYDDGSKWEIIYDANKEAIEADAKKHGKESSSNGHWIWPGLNLTIPGISNAETLKVQKL